MSFPFYRRYSKGKLASALLLTLAWLGGTSPAYADSSVAFSRKAPATCYCCCAVSQAQSGCAKMCETARYASRWWATSCAKPRRKPNPNPAKAGPRLPHPDRAEHARVQPQSDVSPSSNLISR
jgi:hypothetical protein